MTNNCNHITRTYCFAGKRHDFIKIGWSEIYPKWYTKWCSRCGGIFYQYQQGKNLVDVINGFLVPGCINSIDFEEEEMNGEKEVISNSR